MLVTIAAQDLPRARPMNIVRYEEGGVFYFLSADRAPKMSELKRDARSALVLQSATRFISVSGYSRELEGKDMDALAREFENEGISCDAITDVASKRVSLVRFDAEQAEYWDLSIKEGLKHGWDRIAAVIKVEPLPKVRPSAQAKVEL